MSATRAKIGTPIRHLNIITVPKILCHSADIYWWAEANLLMKCVVAISFYIVFHIISF